jgi:hypothetical protein
MKTFTTVKAKHGNINHGHHDTGEPGAVISRTPGSEGGRQKRTSTTGTSLAAYPTVRRVREGADGKGPEPRAPRRRPTSLGGGPSKKDQHHWHLVGGLPYRPAGSGKGRRKRTRTTGTSPAAYFTLRGRGAAMRPAYPAVSCHQVRDSAVIAGEAADRGRQQRHGCSTRLAVASGFTSP